MARAVGRESGKDGIIARVHNPMPSSPHATATMRANRGKDTAPEVALRAALHRRGLRFRKNRRLDLPNGQRVQPDIVFSRLRLVVFVDGCFWHGCAEHRSIPVSNAGFWTTKIEGTRRRDALHKTWLEAAGWTVLRVWEHEPVEAAADRIFETVALIQRQEPAE